MWLGQDFVFSHPHSYVDNSEDTKIPAYKVMEIDDVYSNSTWSFLKLIIMLVVLLSCFT